jgi:hypothetical protein
LCGEAEVGEDEGRGQGGLELSLLSYGPLSNDGVPQSLALGLISSHAKRRDHEPCLSSMLSIPRAGKYEMINT